MPLSCSATVWRGRDPGGVSAAVRWDGTESGSGSVGHGETGEWIDWSSESKLYMWDNADRV